MTVEECASNRLGDGTTQTEHIMTLKGKVTPWAKLILGTG